MSNIEIKKAKIKNGIFLAYEYVEKTDNYENKIATSSDAPIHEDLRSAFQSLVPHFTFLTEETKEFISDEETLEKFKVTGFSIGGSGDTEGIVISGHKKLESGKVVNFNTPFQLFDDEDYEYVEDLRGDVEHLKNEVYEYMEGKQAPKMQVGTLDFGDDDDDEAFSIPADVIAANLDLTKGTTVTVSKRKKKAADELTEAEMDYEIAKNELE